MLKLSERLAAVAFLAGNGGVLADVGTDHGYVPVYLVSEGNFPRAIAMDVNPGPLKSAAAHIVMYGMGDYIQTRLSDGVAALSEGEADTILIAGMGGGLIMRILREGQTVCRSARKLVLQPQSELPSVRRFLLEQGYVTDAANMIREGGKYYPMMRVHYEPSGVSSEGARMELYCRYGREILLPVGPCASKNSASKCSLEISFLLPAAFAASSKSARFCKKGGYGASSCARKQILPSPGSSIPACKILSVSCCKYAQISCTSSERLPICTTQF